MVNYHRIIAVLALMIPVLFALFIYAPELLNSLRPWGIASALSISFGFWFMNFKRKEWMEFIQLFSDLRNSDPEQRKLEILRRIILIARQRQSGEKLQKSGVWVFDQGISWIDQGILGETLDQLVLESVMADLEKWNRFEFHLLRAASIPIPVSITVSLFQLVIGFSSLANPEGQRYFAMNVSAAMMTTIFGVVLGSLVLQPFVLKAKKAKAHQEDELRLVSESIRMISENVSVDVLAERLGLSERSAS